MYNSNGMLNFNGDSASGSVDSGDEELLKEITERYEIVEKYVKPQNATKNMDFEAENLQMEFDQKDRYGFYHKEGPSFQEDEAYVRARHKEMKRMKKWESMERQYKDDLSKIQRERIKRPDILNETIKLHQKFGFRVWKGIPQRFRPWAWKLLLHVEASIDSNRGVYKELVETAGLICKDMRQIDLDINRTYRNHELFKDRYSSQQKSLLEVLSAYAIYNKEVGYCQGMNQLAAMLLIFLGDGEVAFWGMHRLMTDDKFMMHGFFKPGFPKLIRFQNHLDKILSKYFSRLKKHIVPLQLAIRIWDVYLMKGDCILIAMAYTVFKMHSNVLKRMNLEEFLEYMQSTLSIDFGYADDDVIKVLYDSMRKLKNDKMLYPPLPVPNDEAIQAHFGSVLHENYDRHKHIGLVIHSRKTSRAPSVCQSISTSPVLERKWAGSEDYPVDSPDNPRSRVTKSTSPTFPAALNSPLTSTPKHGSSIDTNTLSGGRMLHATSFYDNVPETQYREHTDSYERDKFRNADGTLTLQSKMVRVQTEVQTKVTHSLVDSMAYSDAHTSYTDTKYRINQGPDYVTNIILDPDIQIAPDYAISPQRQKFPVSQEDYFGHGIERQTIV